MKPSTFQPPRYWFIILLCVSVAITCGYSLAYLLFVPFKGFLPTTPSGIITEVFANQLSPNDLLVGDQLIRAGSQTWQEFIENSNEILFSGAQRGDNIPMIVFRNGSEKSINWIFPGLNRAELIYRLRQPWWIPYILLCGVIATFLFVRPKNIYWYLLTLFFMFISLWLAAGFVSHTQIFYSRYVTHFLTWIILAIAWHFHWLFPSPLAKAPRLPVWLLYFSCVTIAFIEILTGLNLSVMYLGVFLVASGILALLLAHAIREKAHRDEIRILFGGIILAFIPSVIYSSLEYYDVNTGLLYIPVLMLYAILPLAYIYAIYYHRLGGLEIRANQAIVYLVYAVILFIFALFTELLLNAIEVPPDRTHPITVGVLILVGLASPYLFPKFQLWFNRHIFGISLPPTKLFETYAIRITTSLDKEHLSKLLREEIFPSLLIRQAALLRLETNGSDKNVTRIIPILALNIQDSQLPLLAETPELIQQSDQIRSHDNPQQPCPWANLVFLLKVEDRMIGLCLLGRRDPDDYYSPSEIPTLQALMNQTALALLNIEQAENLRILYQRNIDRQEAEQLNLARMLHDDVLSQMALLAQYVDPSKMNAKFNLAYQTSVAYIRNIIANLRPATLNYGLQVALEELVSDFNKQITSKERTPTFNFNIPPNQVRYPSDVELHLYRVVQQALNNALTHAHAKVISLEGCMEIDSVKLVINDDGVGFPANENMEMTGLLASKHYGLAGMHERATLIGASLQIDSKPGYGTRINVIWSNRHP
jgi:signal transduction histidine kinase